MPDRASRIKLHYRRLGLTEGWSRERFRRLCHLLHCTEAELAAMCGVFEAGRLAKWIQRNNFPTYVSLHFALIESAYLQTVKGVPQKPAMPFHLLSEPEPPTGA